ncbi:UNVERIFIED_CONTAM: hypothetical protein FKN15_056757 [Acipenser sinensis]
MEVDISVKEGATASPGIDSQNANEEFKSVKSKKSNSKRKRKLEDGQMETEVHGAAKRPEFPPISGDKLDGSDDMRKIAVPSHRYTPLKENWLKIYTPIVEHLQLQIRFNLKTRNVEIKDALALIRLDDLFLETFDVTDGSPPSKVYGNIRAVASRAAERF